MPVQFTEGEYLVVANVFTTSTPHKWLREEVLWHGKDTTLADAHARAVELRAAQETAWRQVSMRQAYEDL